MPSAPVSEASAQRSLQAGARASVTVDPQERIDSLLAHVGTRAGGLSSREVQRRLARFGPNEISRVAGPGWWRELIRQLAHPLELLLWLAAALAAASGSHTLAIAIVAVIVLNAALARAGVHKRRLGRERGVAPRGVAGHRQPPANARPDHGFVRAALATQRSDAHQLTSPDRIWRKPVVPLADPRRLQLWLCGHTDAGALTIAFGERAVRCLRGSSKHGTSSGGRQRSTAAAA